MAFQKKAEPKPAPTQQEEKIDFSSWIIPALALGAAALVVLSLIRKRGQSVASPIKETVQQAVVKPVEKVKEHFLGEQP